MCRLCYWRDGFINVEPNFCILQLSNAVEQAGKLVDQLIAGVLVTLDLVDLTSTRSRSLSHS